MKHRPFSLTTAAVLGAALLASAPLVASDAPYYVLDGFGGVHAGGGAPTIAATTPYFGFDIARDIVYVPGTTGDGIVVLDGFGGIHTGGSAGPVTPTTPYFGFDVARAIAYRNVPPRVAGSAASSITDFSAISTVYTVIRTVSINAPDDGFLLVTGSAYVGCSTATESDNLSAEITINVDATTEPAAISDMGTATFPTCDFAANDTLFQTDNQTLVHVFPVSAGNHTVNLLARKSGGSAGASARILGRSITAVFIDLDDTGNS